MSSIEATTFVLLLLLFFLALVAQADPTLEAQDANVLREELTEVSELIERLQNRRKVLQRALDLEIDGLQSFNEAFIPLANIGANDVGKSTITFVDVFRILRRDKLGQVFFTVAAAKNGSLSVYEANGGSPLATVSLATTEACVTKSDNADQKENVDTCSESSSALATIDPSSPEKRIKLKDMRTGAGGSKPFIVTLDESGLVRLHGLALKRGNLMEKASLWREDPSDIKSSDLSVTNAVLRKDVYIHINGTASIMTVYSTAQRSLVVLGMENGHIHIVDPVSFKSFVDVPISEGTSIVQFSITQSQLAIALADGSIRFMTLGTNKLINNMRCTLAPGLGSIVSMTWLETKSPSDKSRFFFAISSQNDLIMFDRRSPDVPTTPKPSGAARNLFTSLVGSPTGKACNAVRRLPKFSSSLIVSLPLAQLLVMTKRGPEVYNASTLFASFGGNLGDDSDQAYLRRTDFVTSTTGNPSDFAVILRNRDGKGAKAYSYLISTASAAGGGASSMFGDSSYSGSGSTIMDMLGGVRTPLLFVVVICGGVLSLSRRFGGGKQRGSSMADGRRLANRFAGGGMKTGGGRRVMGSNPSMSVTFEDLGGMDDTDWSGPPSRDH